MKRDLEHLQLLAVSYTILAAVMALLVAFMLIGDWVATAMTAQFTGGGLPFPRTNHIDFFPLPLGGFLATVCLGLAAFCLSRRRGHTFCEGVACITCLCLPVGTVLGIFTLKVLSRPRMKDLFDGKIVYRDPEDEDHDSLQEPFCDRADDQLEINFPG